MGPSRLTAILRTLYVAVTDLRWWVLALAVLLHMALSWALMAWAGEPDLTGAVAFLYWYATTASTVGYGDLSPSTDAGRLVAAFIVYPGAIAAFTSVVAKGLSGLSDLWRRRRMGLGDYGDVRNAVVLVGYDEARTPRMVDELVADAEPGQDIVLVARREMVNEDPRIRYVRARSLTAAADLERAGVAEAARVIVFAANDEETLSAALAIAALNRGGHIVCFFESEENARLLTAHCPEIEVVLAPTVELVVKAVKDPGASHLLHLLVSHTDKDATLFSMTWQGPATSFGEVAAALMRQGAILIASREGGDDRAPFRFDTEGAIASGDSLFYVAERRLPAQPSTAGTGG